MSFLSAIRRSVFWTPAAAALVLVGGCADATNDDGHRTTRSAIAAPATTTWLGSLQPDTSTHPDQTALTFSDGRLFVATTAIGGQGGVAVFERDPANLRQWDGVATLRHPELDEDARFGSALAVRESLALVASEGDETQRGEVHVFQRRSTSEYEATTTLSDPERHEADRFGAVLALGERHLAVVSGTAAEPSVYVYDARDSDPGSWTIRERLAGPPELGRSLALVGDALFVGAREGAREASVGVVLVYRFDGQSWVESGRLTSEFLADEGTEFGAALTTHGDLLFVGAPGRAGAVAVYRVGRDGPQLVTVLRDRGFPDGFGREISADRTRLAVSTAGTRPRTVLFEREGDAWRRLTTLEPAPNTVVGTWGSSLALATGHVFVAAGSRVDYYGPNTAPATRTVRVETLEDESVDFTLSGYDPDGDALEFRLVTPAGLGVVSGSPPNVRYTPFPDVHGFDSFEYRVIDAGGLAQPGVATISIAPVNDRPRIETRYEVCEFEQQVALKLHGTDVDGDFLRFTVMDPPRYGTLEGKSPDLVYRPKLGFSGVDRIGFVAFDGTEESHLKTIDIRVLEPRTVSWAWVAEEKVAERAALDDRREGCSQSSGDPSWLALLGLVLLRARRRR